MIIIKKVFLALSALTLMQSIAIAADGHSHGKKASKHSEKEKMCDECKDKKDCTCEKEENKNDHDHKEGDGHSHGKKKTKSTKPASKPKQ